ncbi:MAG TPA: MerR family transcriptional regulator [Bacteroidetes bacterium]|nr:MAG: MerR family transcriptional regulator [Ignavibacteria bacterium GWA2_54_16]HCA81221.1 MerR family transcriptional regulator [Bacteroidota bacterium]
MRESKEIPTIQDPQAPVYSIGTVARMIGVSVFTLRMYEREGLILAEKSESNQRRYSQNDIERLKCIRRAITEQKFGIAGIRTIFSMIPCWNIVQCSENDRKNCEAYRGHSGPCWSLKHLNNTCTARTCRDCTVYKDFADCGKVKQSIVNISPAP